MNRYTIFIGFIFSIFIHTILPGRTIILMPILKQFSDLQDKDFLKYPIWVQCHLADSSESWYDKTDEETFRPWTKKELNPQNIYLVSCSFKLTDGTIFQGFISPPLGKSSDFIHPYIFLNGKLFSFYFGAIKPNMKMVSLKYRQLRKTKEQVFPISLSVVINQVQYRYTGTIQGFSYLGKGFKIERY